MVNISLIANTAFSFSCSLVYLDHCHPGGLDAVEGCAHQARGPLLVGVGPVDVRPHGYGSLDPFQVSLSCEVFVDCCYKVIWWSF